MRVLHQTESGTATQVVNVARVVSGETGTEDLPRLEPGDTVIVPDDQVLTAADRESGVQVLGEVAAPGFYPVEAATPLMTLILQAGGFSDAANLRVVRVVHDTGRGVTESHEVNVRNFLEQGQVSGNPLLYAGDTVYVEAQPVARSFLRTVPGIITSMAGLVAIILSVSNSN